MKKTLLALSIGILTLGCASLGSPSSPQESCLVVKVEVRNPDNTPTENGFRLKFNQDIPHAYLSPQHDLVFIKRNFPTNAMTTAVMQFNTGNYVGTEIKDIPYRSSIDLRPGEIGLLKDKMVITFTRGDTPGSYRFRWQMTPLTPQERSNIIQKVNKDPDISHWTWSKDSVEGLHLGQIPTE